MRILFNGAARTVTGSQHLVEVNGHKLLLDCGLYQGKRADTYLRNQHFAFDPKSIDAVLLSHAHIDHSGNLPNLVKSGFNGPIYSTPPTATLGEVMLMDSAHIHEADAQYVNKKRSRRGEPPIEPLYTQQDAAEAIERYYPMKYAQPFSPVPGVTVTFFDAGHILGSAAIRLDIEENGSRKSLWFSGDIGRPALPLIGDPVFPSDVDYLLMECTYGDMEHFTVEQAFENFKQVAKRTFKRGGKLIIPAFAVGRAQEIIFFLNRLVTAGDVPRVPVYVDSPLAVAASQIFTQYPEYFDHETNQFIREHRHPALDFEGLTYVSSVEESKSLNDKKGPLVIISASGMSEAGRILHHLKNNIENPRNTVLIAGWQAPNTLGRRLTEGVKEVRIYGQLYDLRAEVVSINGLSAHAGQKLLLEYASAVRGRVKKVFLVHGEEDAAGVFMTRLRELGFTDVIYPQLNDNAEL